MPTKSTTHEAEVWKPVGASSCYYVSNLGRIRSSQGKIKTPTRTRDGICVVNLYEDGKTDVRAVHTIVAHTFLGARPPGHMVIHQDGDQCNCRASNLRYVPLSLRQPKNPDERGKYLVGKLTKSEAQEIRMRANAGEATVQLAKEFGVSASLVSSIKSGRKWKS